jgi:hypothetical protein
MEGGVINIKLQQCFLKEQIVSWVEEFNNMIVFFNSIQS